MKEKWVRCQPRINNLFPKCYVDSTTDDFNGLKPEDVKDIFIVKIGQLPDGRTVILRKVSTDTRPTLEIYDGKKSIKIRYGDK